MRTNLPERQRLHCPHSKEWDRNRTTYPTSSPQHRSPPEEYHTTTKYHWNLKLHHKTSWRLRVCIKNNPNKKLHKQTNITLTIDEKEMHTIKTIGTTRSVSRWRQDHKTKVLFSVPDPLAVVVVYPSPLYPFLIFRLPRSCHKQLLLYFFIQIISP